MSDIALYIKYIKMTVASQMAYKLSFVFSAIGHFFITMIEFVGIYALFLRFDNIGNWNLQEVAVFYGFVNMTFAVAEGVGRGFDVFHKYVQQGSFDRILLRPRSIFMQILGTEFQLMRIGRLTQGIGVFVWGLYALEHALSLRDAMTLLNAFAGATAFFLALMVFQAALSFWTVESLEVVNVFTYGGVQTAQYPIDIYKKWFQKIFIFIVPLGSVTYFPLVSVLKGSQPLLGFFMPFLGWGFLLIAIGVFRLGVRQYCSTGS